MIKLLFLILLVGCTLLIIRVLVNGEKTFLHTIFSAACGICGLAVVNLFSAATGVAIAVNYITCFISVVFSVPGVVLLLVAQFIF